MTKKELADRYQMLIIASSEREFIEVLSEIVDETLLERLEDGLELQFIPEWDGYFWRVSSEVKEYNYRQGEKDNFDKDDI